jgi:hypothetical protein
MTDVYGDCQTSKKTACFAIVFNTAGQQVYLYGYKAYTREKGVISPYNRRGLTKFSTTRWPSIGSVLSSWSWKGS